MINDLVTFLRSRFVGALGRQGIIGRRGSFADVPRISHGLTQGRVVVARSLVSELEDSKDGPDRFSNLVNGAMRFRVDLLQRFTQDRDLFEAAAEFLLLGLKNVNEFINVIQGALSGDTVLGLFQDSFVFRSRHEIQMFWGRLSQEVGS